MHVQVGGDFVSIQAVATPLAGVGSGAEGGAGRGGGAAGGGGGGRSWTTKRKKQAPPEVVAVERVSAGGWGPARARGSPKPPVGGAAEAVSAGEVSDGGGGRKRKSEAESEADHDEGWGLAPSKVGWETLDRRAEGSVAWGSLDRGPTPSFVYTGESDEAITSRLAQLNAAEDCTLNEKVFAGSSVSGDDVRTANGVLGVLQRSHAGRRKDDGWSLLEFDAAVKVGVVWRLRRLAPGGVCPGLTLCLPPVAGARAGVVR